MRNAIAKNIGGLALTFALTTSFAISGHAQTRYSNGNIDVDGPRDFGNPYGFRSPGIGVYNYPSRRLVKATEAYERMKAGYSDFFYTLDANTGALIFNPSCVQPHKIYDPNGTYLRTIVVDECENGAPLD